MIDVSSFKKDNPTYITVFTHLFLALKVKKCDLNVHDHMILLLRLKKNEPDIGDDPYIKIFHPRNELQTSSKII